jgi:predicted Zn-ribbon and HTH transcriptional regulator
MSAGKGDKPRNCFSKNYKDNYDSIAWANTIKCPKCKSNMKKHFKTCPNCGFEIKANSER